MRSISGVMRAPTLVLVAGGLLSTLAFRAPVAHAATPMCHGEAATIVGTSGNDTRTGRPDMT